MTYREPIAELVDSSEPVPVADPAPAPAPEPSPEPAPTEEPKVDPTPETPPAEPTLYELPDGRKVDAETLQREWKENFLPEFTRKSQRLAEIERSGKDNINRPDDEPEWKKPDYVPSNYAEVIELAKREALNEIKSTYEQEQARVKAVQDAVDSEIADIKKIDPKLDENALFQHANKYGFSSLKHAYSNMQDLRKVILDTEQRTVKNLKTRETDPVATTPGGDIPGEDIDPVTKFESASEYLDFIKGKK